MGSKIIKPPTKDVTAINGILRHHPPTRRALLVGSRKHEYQSLIGFDITCLPCFATILSGTLTVYLFDNYLPHQEKTITVHQILSTWRRGRALVTNPLPVASASVGNSKHVFISFDITPLVINWYTGDAVNLGVLLKLEDKASPCLVGSLAFCSKYVRNSQCWPFLEVSFLEPVPPIPSGGCCQTLDFDISVSTSDIVNTTATLNIQRFNYTYYIINTGTNSATVSMQLSPDGTNWLTDEPLRVITPGAILPFVPNVIARFARLTYQSTNCNHSTTLDIRVRGCSS